MFSPPPLPPRWHDTDDKNGNRYCRAFKRLKVAAQKVKEDLSNANTYVSCHLRSYTCRTVPALQFLLLLRGLYDDDTIDRDTIRKFTGSRGALGSLVSELSLQPRCLRMIKTIFAKWRHLWRY